ncbi:MAG: aminotransferase class V-fold PLP-dependent enzyme [Acidobacteriales bacterium]|nr:aminotransferase class V-fold PLP-dependent enzyme [Terriglobales bacterium]
MSAMIDRRSFLAFSAAGLVTSAIPLPLLSQALSAPPLPDRKLPDAEYWGAIRKQFAIPENEIYLNNGTCGSTPAPVLKAVFDAFEKEERMEDDNPEQYPLFGYGPFDQYREPLARFINASKDEIAIVRNATEANAIMANGLDLAPGDEVILSDQEHPSGNGPWDMRAKRYGIVIRRVHIPKPATSPDQVLDAIAQAITPRTKAIFVSHITTDTGVVLPVKQICALARSKNIVSMIDGAQVAGMMPIDVKDIGCDMYGSSPHKWLMSPKGSGFLYVRDEMIDRVWSNTTSAGWDDRKSRAARFQQYGSSNIPIVAGMVASIDFANQIGLDRIERRGRELSDYALNQMKSRGIESWTSPDPRMRCAITTYNLAPIKIGDMERAMWNEHRIRIRGGAPSKLRLSTPYYLQKQDLDTFFARFDEYRKSPAART